MTTFDKAFERLIGHEGGYSDNPLDPGKKTMYGITEKVARANGYAGSMRDLPLATAKQIAKTEYWDKVKADSFHPAVAFNLFDIAYNSGNSRAIKILQEAVGTTPDGIIGRLTIAAAARMSTMDIIACMCAVRIEFYTSLGTWPEFGKGWARRVAANLKYGVQDQ